MPASVAIFVAKNELQKYKLHVYNNNKNQANRKKNVINIIQDF